MRLTYQAYRRFVYRVLFVIVLGGIFFHAGMAYKENQLATIINDDTVSISVEVVNRPFGLKGLVIHATTTSEVEEQLLEALKGLGQ